MMEPKHPTITEDEIVIFLRDIEAGRIVLFPLEDPQEIYTGNVTYKASTGWAVVVFINANEWDYIHSITADDGRTVDYDDIYDRYWRVMSEYEPTGDVAWKRYQLPGNMRFRCTRCDLKILGGLSYRSHKTDCSLPE